MAIPDSERREYASETSSFLGEIVSPGFEHLAGNPDFLDKHTVPGHFPWGFTGRREGLFVETLDEKQPWVADYTNYWMTLPIDTSKHFGNDPELLKEIGRLTLAAGTTSEFGSVHEDIFINRMRQIWPDAQRIALYNSGTQATDMAMKWANALVMNREVLDPGDMRVVASESAFHGRAGWGIEATRTSVKTADFQTGRVLRIPDPVIIYRENGDVDKDETEMRLQTSVEILQKHFDRPEVSSLILEYPMIAEGGAMPVNPEFLKAASELGREKGKLLIVDSVQMFGKTGGWLHPDTLKYADAVTIGKYSRVCAALFRDVSDKGYTDDYIGTPGKVGGTWMAHVGQFLATNAIMKVVDDKNLFDNGVKQATDFYSFLRYMSLKGTGVVRPRITGSYVGVDIPDKRNEVIQKLQERGILILPAGDQSIRFAPRLDAENWENEFLWKNLEEVLEKTASLTHA